MGEGEATTTQLAPWHWRDKFDARNPEEANRQQLLKIEKQISFAKWLKEKRREERKRNAALAAAAAAKLDEEQREREAKEKERKEDKRRQRADAKQRREQQRANERAEAQQREHAKEKMRRLRAKKDKVKHAYTSVMRSKPEVEPQRPTFKEWMARKKREGKEQRKTDCDIPPVRVDLSSKSDDDSEKAQRAYDVWMARKLLEDRVKQKLSKEERLQRALDEQLLHARTWQKKAVVCAYSQNQSEKTKWRATTASLLS